MSRLPLEQMMASLRVLSAPVSNWGTGAGAGTVALVPEAVCVAAVVVMAGFLCVCRVGGSDATVRLGKACDVGHLVRRLLREQREELLDGDAGQGADAAQGGGLALVGVVLSKEADRLPVCVSEGDADLGCEGCREVFVPLGVLGEE